LRAASARSGRAGPGVSDADGDEVDGDEVVGDEVDGDEGAICGHYLELDINFKLI
jgi:hypothetical protein